MTDIMTKQTTITLPFETVVRGLNAVLPHIGKDPLTPILETVLITSDTFMATNRNTIGRFRHGGTIDGDDVQIELPRDAAIWLTKLTPADLNVVKPALKNLLVTFSISKVSVHFDGVDADPQVTRAITSQSNFGFPPVGRLFDSWTLATIPLTPTFNADELAMFTTSAKKLTSGKRREDLAMTVELGQPSDGSNYLGPVRVTIGDDFDGLIMPLRQPRY